MAFRELRSERNVCALPPSCALHTARQAYLPRLNSHLSGQSRTGGHISMIPPKADRAWWDSTLRAVSARSLSATKAGRPLLARSAHPPRNSTQKEQRFRTKHHRSRREKPTVDLAPFRERLHLHSTTLPALRVNASVPPSILGDENASWTPCNGSLSLHRLWSPASSS